MSTAEAGTIEAGVVVMHTNGTSLEPLARLAKRLVEDTRPELERATGKDWQFHLGDIVPLKSEADRRAADFIPEASLRLTEGSFDLLVVVTDVGLLSRSDRLVSGLASPLTRICVLSTHRLQRTGRSPIRSLDDSFVRWNAGALLIHLVGHVLGARRHRKGEGAMAPFVAQDDRQSIPRFRDLAETRSLARHFGEREHRTRNFLHELAVHLLALLRSPLLVARALARNRALLLPLRMPGLATAAVAPIFLLVFTAEFWDAGLGMSNWTAIVYALLSMAGATIYLTFGQGLFLPRKEERVLPEHLAVANVVIFMTMFFAVIGLFAMVALLTLAIELWIFPPDLISTWPTLQDPHVTIADKARLAVFISTVGVTTGSLAGGLEKQQIMRHLALFRTEV